MTEVYIIVDRNGYFAIGIETGKGKVYADKQKAEEALKRKNEWAKNKGYGKHELITLEVEE